MSRQREQGGDAQDTEPKARRAIDQPTTQLAIGGESSSQPTGAQPDSDTSGSADPPFAPNVAPLPLQDDWPPRVLDYGGGAPDATVRDPSGVSTRDLAYVDTIAFQDRTPPEAQLAAADLAHAPHPWQASVPGVMTSAPDTTSRQVHRKGNVDPHKATATLPHDLSSPEALDDGPTQEALPDMAMAMGSIETKSGHQPRAKGLDEQIATEQAVAIDEAALYTASRAGEAQPAEQPAGGRRVMLVAATATVFVLGVAIAGLIAASSWYQGGRGADSGGSLIIHTNREAACTVFLNDRPTKLMSPGSSLHLDRLKPGVYRLSVRCIGYASFERSESIVAGQLTVVNATLLEER